MILQIKKLTIIEDASPDNVVTLVPVTEGPEGSAVFGITNEHENFFIEDRQTYVDRGNPTCEIAVLKPDTADITQLETWVNNQTDVYVSALTVDGVFLFGDKETTTGAIKIVANEQLSDNDLFSVRLQRQTTPGFSPDTGLHQNGFWAGENLLGGYVWGDANGNGIADGWEASAFDSESFASGTQTLTADETQARFRREIYFPYEGQEVTFSVDIDSIGANNEGLSLRIQYINASGSIIGITNGSQISSTGRASLTTSSIPSGTVSVRPDVSVLATAGNTFTVDISDPCLRIGTGTTYTKF